MNKPAIASNWLLEVSNLRCGYGGEAVVKNVSVALRRGDIGCLLGPSHQPARQRSRRGAR
jgi:iron(III) transport system ATP-binding protein